MINDSAYYARARQNNSVRKKLKSRDKLIFMLLSNLNNNGIDVQDIKNELIKIKKDEDEEFNAEQKLALKLLFLSLALLSLSFLVVFLF